MEAVVLISVFGSIAVLVGLVAVFLWAEFWPAGEHRGQTNQG